MDRLLQNVERWKTGLSESTEPLKKEIIRARIRVS